MRRFEIIDEECGDGTPCGILSCDQSTMKFSVKLREGVSGRDVPLAFAPFVDKGELDIPEKWVKAWIAERIAPPSRQNIGEILAAHGVDEYDPCELLASGEGRSTQDGFFLREISPGYKRAGILGRTLARKREAAGMTQAELARKSGVRAETISRIEHGNANPTLGTIEQLAEALGQRLEVKLAPDARFTESHVPTALPQ